MYVTEELLRMRPCLSARSGRDMFLDELPILAMQLKSFKESQVLGEGPTTIPG